MSGGVLLCCWCRFDRFGALKGQCLRIDLAKRKRPNQTAQFPSGLGSRPTDQPLKRWRER